jgi:hypothetical protein
MRGFRAIGMSCSAAAARNGFSALALLSRLVFSVVSGMPASITLSVSRGPWELTCSSRCGRGWYPTILAESTPASRNASFSAIRRFGRETRYALA